jgi:hypothetical protein
MKMRKETIAKIQIIAGIILILLTICLSYYFMTAGIQRLQTPLTGYQNVATTLINANQTSPGTASLLSILNWQQMGINTILTVYLGILLDLIILAQAAMLILSGLKCLAKE